MSNGFDLEFATPAEWATLYREQGIQVVPGFMPSEVKTGQSWKRPLLKSWTEFQETLIPDEVFAQWYGPDGQYAARRNMGVICGHASRNTFIIDLDVHKNPAAAQWWQGVLAVHNNSMELETAEQRTGGGGLQKLFHAPANWIAPTNKTSIGVDIRGQGGFAVLCPSIHESGRAYEWLEGRSPDEIEILMAPAWLLEAVEEVVRKYGGAALPLKGTIDQRTNGPHPYTPVVQNETDGFGALIDGRESYMRDMVWAAVVDWRRECADMPSYEQSRRKAAEKYLVYHDHVEPQMVHLNIPNKMDALEAEGRGTTLFHVKWQAAMRQWDGKVAQEAKEKTRQNNRISSLEQRQDKERARPLNKPIIGPLILTAAQFLKGFRPPDYLVDGMIQKGYLYSLTARTGHGKTAIAMLLGTCVARGIPFHGKPTEQGGVLFLAGENPDDIRARYLALAAEGMFDPHSIPFHFIDGVINIQASLPRIREEAAKIPNLSLVVVDTQAAFFMGDEGNSNEQQGNYARLFRELVKLPGKPTVLVNCHPVKNATQDNLVPMGGSGFMNEVDCNLTLWAEDKTCVLGPHPDKWRGVNLESMAFDLKTVVCNALKDTKNRPMPSVVAVPITEGMADRRRDVLEDDNKIVLRLLNVDKNLSVAGVAKKAGWMMGAGEPAKSRVQRTYARLYKNKFLYKYDDNHYRLTKKGCKLIGAVFRDADDDEYG